MNTLYVENEWNLPCERGRHICLVVSDEPVSREWSSIRVIGPGCERINCLISEIRIVPKEAHAISRSTRRGFALLEALATS